MSITTIADKKLVFVGLSGGVDSSVAAALLVRAGHDVVGAFMKNWSDSKNPRTGLCAWKEERRDAMAVADRLGLPFVTYDFEEAYREAVVDYLCAEYAAGRTPNPDVMCNKHIKFDLFLSRARDDGADAIATGHYARVAEDPQTGLRRLLAGIDANKDQSYFLHQMTQEQLARAEFPIGCLTKPEVRRLAKEFGLPTADKKDSQGICFIGKVDLKDFLAHRIQGRPGPIITTDGHVVGRHRGVAPFTIGQRHGLGLGGGAPYFVAEKDAARNTLVVARDGDASLYAQELAVAPMHWIDGAAPAKAFNCSVRIRYRQPLQRAFVAPAEGGAWTVKFESPQRAVSPGQFAVLYDGDVCLGGGVIQSAVRA